MPKYYGILVWLFFPRVSEQCLLLHKRTRVRLEFVCQQGPAIEKKFFRPCFKGSGVEGRVLRNDGCIWTKSCPPRKNTSKLTTYTHLNIWHLLILSKKKLKCKFCVSLFEKGFSHPDFFRSSESKSTGKPENEFFSRAFAAEEKFE